MKIFLDANVLFSASNPASNIHRLAHRLSKSHTLVTSHYAWEEASRNLRIKRPAWEPDFLLLLKKVAILPGVDRPVDAPISEKDRPILATAIAEHCNYLATGDRRDFGHLYGHCIQGVRIITPLEAAGLLVQDKT
jgi:predicted nucleic acid-binding protein